MLISFVSKHDSFEPGSQVHVLQVQAGHYFHFIFLGETKNKWLSCGTPFWEVGVGGSKGGEIGRKIDI